MYLHTLQLLDSTLSVQSHTFPLRTVCSPQSSKPFHVLNPLVSLRWATLADIPSETKNVPDAPDDEDVEDWGQDDPAAMTASDRLSKLRMSNLVKQYLQAQSLEVLVENGMEDAVMRFVDKDDRDAIKE